MINKTQYDLLFNGSIFLNKINVRKMKKFKPLVMKVFTIPALILGMVSCTKENVQPEGPDNIYIVNEGIIGVYMAPIENTRAYRSPDNSHLPFPQ